MWASPSPLCEIGRGSFPGKCLVLTNRLLGYAQGRRSECYGFRSDPVRTQLARGLRPWRVHVARLQHQAWHWLWLRQWFYIGRDLALSREL
jgi:hypothetical protein